MSGKCSLSSFLGRDGGGNSHIQRGLQGAVVHIQANRLLDFNHGAQSDDSTCLDESRPFLSQPAPMKTMEGHPSDTHSMVKHFLNEYCVERPMLLRLTYMLVER